MTSDESAYFTHLAEGNARQARKRVAADVLVRDEAGRVLLVDPSYKSEWDLPGGMAEDNETPRCAAAREFQEELGTMLEVGRLLAIEWVAPHGPWDDLLAFIFDGGMLTPEQITALKITDCEISAIEFVHWDEAEHRLRPYVWQRLHRARKALLAGSVDYYERLDIS
jgi:8-oxo-dGTP diphosphatase